LKKDPKIKRIDREIFLQTSHLKGDLKGRSVRGSAVTIAAQGCKFFTQIGSTIVLARLLTPDDYGLVGMVAVVLRFAELFKHLGLATATIQKEEINHRQVSTLFWINLAFSLAIAFIIALLAPALSWFYQKASLTPITLALATTFIFSGLTVQHQALLTRQMRFLSLAIIEITAMLFGAIAAIISAFYGAGYWALVILQIVTAIANAIGTWVVCGWRPSMVIEKAGIGSMLALGGNITGFNALNYFARNLDNILIGRVWGSYQLGLYDRAYQLLLLPLQQINLPISAVAIPALSRLQAEPQKLRQFYLKALSIVGFLTFPLIILIIVLSEEIIEILLGSHWLGASLIFRLLAISAIVQPVCNTTGWLYISTNRTDRMFKWGLFASFAIVLSFFMGLPYGAKGVALSYAVVMLIQAPICIIYAIKGTAIKLADFWEAIYRVFVASTIAGIMTFSIKLSVAANLSIWSRTIVSSVAMTIVYLIIIGYVFKQKEFYLSLFSNFKKERN
jgi:O-antigen/teichoic acid export membrane protein